MAVGERWRAPKLLRSSRSPACASRARAPSVRHRVPHGGDGGPPGSISPGAHAVVSVDWASGHLKLTLTCSSLPPSMVLLTVIVVPEPATLVDAHGLAEDQ